MKSFLSIILPLLPLLLFANNCTGGKIPALSQNITECVCPQGSMENGTNECECNDLQALLKNGSCACREGFYENATDGKCVSMPAEIYPGSNETNLSGGEEQNYSRESQEENSKQQIENYGRNQSIYNTTIQNGSQTYGNSSLNQNQTEENSTKNQTNSTDVPQRKVWFHHFNQPSLLVMTMVLMAILFMTCIVFALWQRKPEPIMVQEAPPTEENTTDVNTSVIR